MTSVPVLNQVGPFGESALFRVTWTGRRGKWVRPRWEFSWEGEEHACSGGAEGRREDGVGKSTKPKALKLRARVPTEKALTPETQQHCPMEKLKPGRGRAAPAR